MKISLFQIIVIGAFVAAAGIGLFVFATYSGSSNNANTAPVVIWGTLPASAFTATIQQAGKDSVLAVASYVQKQPETFESEYINAAASGNAPDLLVVSSDQLLGLWHTLTPISYDAVPERNFRDTFIDATDVLLGPEGLYGVPLALDPLVLYYNRPMLASANIAEAPRTWEEVAALVPKIASVDSRKEVVRAAVALGGYGNIVNAKEIIATLFMQAGVPLEESSQGGPNASFFTRTVTGGDVPAEAALRYYLAFANPAQDTYTWNGTLPSSRASFLGGTLALYLGFGSEYASLRQGNPNLSFDIARMPQPGTATLRSTYGKVYAFVLPKASKNPAGALTVALAFTPNETMKAFADNVGTLAPVRRDLLSANTSDPIASVVYKDALVARGWLSPNASATDTIFGAMISNVISGRTRIIESLTTAERAISAAY